jgi:hypothetical protein
VKQRQEDPKRGRLLCAEEDPGLPRDFRITIKPRIVEGQFVIDQEHFSGIVRNSRQATWMYLVRDGFIQRAWVLESNPIP